MNSLPAGFNAIVVGASGAIGGAFAKALSNTPNCGAVIGLSRQTNAAFDISNEDSIAELAQALQPRGPFHFIVDATGALHIDGVGPEKRMEDVNADKLINAFMINSIGPALLLKHFVPLMPMNARCVFAKLSARVGSITDNRKGGWYSYRASKAALNMILQTAAIEVARKRPEAILVALQPGTVRSKLTAPFVPGDNAMDPTKAVEMLLNETDKLAPSGKALFIDYRGKSIAW
jgi:NAD(P)-dependent dehydrogenase (short-subunit alcohol dehydrogenase family)